MYLRKLYSKRSRCVTLDSGSTLDGVVLHWHSGGDLRVGLSGGPSESPFGQTHLRVQTCQVPYPEGAFQSFKFNTQPGNLFSY